jgi:hypothetical protein
MGLLHRAALFGLLLGTGCGTDKPDDGLLPGLDLPPPPENGMRLITPPVRGLEPGSNHEMCTWTGVKVDDLTQIRSATGWQLNSGHHILVFSTKINMPPGTQRECNDEDMAEWHQVLGTGGEGTVAEAPGDLVYEVPAGEYLTIQHHYINASDQTLDSQSVVDLAYADPGKTYTPSHAVAFVNTTIDLPPGPDMVTYHCTMANDVKAWMVLPHMHAWGKTFNATVTHAGVATKMVDNLTWDPSYTFHPPQNMYDVNSPFLFHVGDQIDITCNWFNDTSSDLFFGKEMCVMYAQTIDDTHSGNILCDNGNWGTF